MDPCALRELVPDCEKTAPLDTPVTGDAAYFLTAGRAWKLPITPPPLANHGNYVVSLNHLVKWLGGLAEKKGVNIFTQFAGENSCMKVTVKTRASRASSPTTRASTKTASPRTTTRRAMNCAPKSRCSPKARAVHSQKTWSTA